MKIDSNANLSRAVLLASVAVILAGLYFAREVLVPAALSFLFAFLLSPLVARLERIGLPRVPAVLVVVLLAFAAFGGFVYMVAGQAVELGQRLPEYRENILQKVQALKSSTGGVAGSAIETIRAIGQELSGGQGTSAVPVRMVDSGASAYSFLSRHLSSLLGPLGTAGIVIILVVFMLIEREDLRERFIRLAGKGDLNLTTQAMNEASQRISRYLLMQLLINVTYGLPVALGLYLIGVEGALLWGLMATLLRFIPYLGPWIAAAFPILVSLAVPGWTMPLYTIGLFIVIELFSNNVIEPWLYGSSTGLSSLAVLGAAVFWAWLWGAVGLLLSVPLTACLVVMGKYIPQLEFFAVLLGDEPALSPQARLYQRLLAWDTDEAEEVVEELQTKEGLPALLDKMLLPALAMAEADVRRGRLDEGRLQFIHTAIGEILDDIEADEPVPAPAPTKGVTVLCLPARNTSDELAGRMLAMLLSRRGVALHVVSESRLASEMVDEVKAEQPGVACISAVPPLSTAPARYLCKRLHQRAAEMPLVIGLWTRKTVSEIEKRRLLCHPQDTLVTTLEDAVNVIVQRTQLSSPAERTAALPAMKPGDTAARSPLENAVNRPPAVH